MKQVGIILAIVITVFAGTGLSAHAAIPLIYTNSTFMTDEHDAPASFTQDSLGNFYGSTVTGKMFSQNIITNSESIRLQRFAIDEAFFYISDRGIIVADSDTIALSIYLTRVG